jgi:hypothetical protein
MMPDDSPRDTDNAGQKKIKQTSKRKEKEKKRKAGRVFE